MTENGVKGTDVNILGEHTEIFKASNSDAMLTIVNEQDMDIALLDIEMPYININGIETAKKPDITIILTSGDEREALSIRVCGFIVKPVTEKLLR